MGLPSAKVNYNRFTGIDHHMIENSICERKKNTPLGLVNQVRFLNFLFFTF